MTSPVSCPPAADVKAPASAAPAQQSEKKAAPEHLCCYSLVASLGLKIDQPETWSATDLYNYLTIGSPATVPHAKRLLDAGVTGKDFFDVSRAEEMERLFGCSLRRTLCLYRSDLINYLTHEREHAAVVAK